MIPVIFLVEFGKAMPQDKTFICTLYIRSTYTHCILEILFNDVILNILMTFLQKPIKTYYFYILVVCVVFYQEHIRPQRTENSFSESENTHNLETVFIYGADTATGKHLPHFLYTLFTLSSATNNRYSAVLQCKQVFLTIFSLLLYCSFTDLRSSQIP